MEKAFRLNNAEFKYRYPVRGAVASVQVDIGPRMSQWTFNQSTAHELDLTDMRWNEGPEFIYVEYK